MPSLSHRDLTHLGMDVHKDSISVGILRPEEESPDVARIFNVEPSVRRLLARFENRRRLSVCYEAGPTGYELHRLLTSMGIRCQVIAPSVIPRLAGDRVKTDKRDSRKLARLHRAGSWWRFGCRRARRRRCGTCAGPGPTWSRISTGPASVWGRSCCATARWGGGSAWTLKHEAWLRARHFEDAALAATFAHYRAVVEERSATLDAVEADLSVHYARPLFADAVACLSAYRGVARMGALTLAAEVCD